MKEFIKRTIKQMLDYREKKHRTFVKRGNDRGKLY